MISNSGVVAADVTGVGTARSSLAATNYGGDKAVFALGNTGTSELTTRNLVSNTGVVSADATGAGTGTSGAAAAGFSLDA